MPKFIRCEISTAQQDCGMEKHTMNLWRWKLCARELHWHAQNANSVITTQRRTKKLIRTEWRPGSIAGSAESILYTKKPNNPERAEVLNYGR